ncbi:hypothetical protein MKX01_030776 [Papaver californicum]|nr:hypothetical protein MKX01_030776 [Papaver californicum]
MEIEKKKPHDHNSVTAPPPDDHRCRRTDGKGWRCKNILSTAHDPSYYCHQHYNSPWHNKHFKRGIPHDSSDDEIQLKRQRVEISEKSTTDQLKRCCTFEEEEEEVKSLEEGIQKCEAELEKILGVCKRKCLQLLAELDRKKMECVGIQGKLDELESMKIAAEDEFKEFKRRQERRRNSDRMVWGKKEERTCGRVAYLERELKKMGKDIGPEKKRVQGEAEFWRDKFCDLEARVLRMENGSVGNSEMCKRDAELSGGRNCSRVSELQTKDKVLNEDEVDMNAHRQVKDEVVECPDMSISSESPNVSCGGQKAEDANGMVERTSLESSKNSPGKVRNTAAANLVQLICLDSDDESVGESFKGSSDCSSGSESLGEVMDRMAMNYRNKVKEVKWEFEADMLSSFEEDAELCMKALCALYRQQTFKEKSAIGFRYLDAVRIKNLAEFLMDGDCKGDLKKSVKELEEELTPNALEDCKRLASRYSKLLFSIYKDKQDPFFLPTSTASC